MTTPNTTTAPAGEAPVAAVPVADPPVAEALAIEAPVAAALAAEPPVVEATAAKPAPPKTKPVTWETERNAAAAALVRAGATPREMRVLASSVARAAAALRPKAHGGPADATAADDQAAQSVLAAHRAAASPAWSRQ